MRRCVSVHVTSRRFQAGHVPPRDRVARSAAAISVLLIFFTAAGEKRSKGPDKDNAPIVSPLAPNTGQAKAAQEEQTRLVNEGAKAVEQAKLAERTAAAERARVVAETWGAWSKRTTARAQSGW